MKLYRFLVTIFLFLLPAISLFFDKKGYLCWLICFTFLFLHLFFIRYVKMTHSLDNIDHDMNINIL